MFKIIINCKDIIEYPFEVTYSIKKGEIVLDSVEDKQIGPIPPKELYKEVHKKIVDYIKHNDESTQLSHFIKCRVKDIISFKESIKSFKKQLNYLYKLYQPTNSEIFTILENGSDDLFEIHIDKTAECIFKVQPGIFLSDRQEIIIKDYYIIKFKDMNIKITSYKFQSYSK